MRFFFNRLSLLLICLSIFGSATPSQFLDYSVDKPTVEEFINRQNLKEDQGFILETEVSPYHPQITGRQTPKELQGKSHSSYTRKSAYY